MKASDRFRHGCGDFRRGGALATIWPTCFILIASSSSTTAKPNSGPSRLLSCFHNLAMHIR
jgi:hypothetical protein